MKHILSLGDGPAAQSEAGQQKGGDYFCGACPASASCSDDICYTYNQPYVSFKERKPTMYC